jgi:lysophospholipase L1-like esterase
MSALAPKTTLPPWRGYGAMALLVVVTILGMDWLAANLFHWVTGVTFYDHIVDPHAGMNKQYRTAHPRFHHDLRPNVNVNARWGPLSYHIATNSLGFKDERPRQVAPIASQRRWLIIGDSMTEGVGYTYAATFVGQMTALLRQQGESVEILNAGVSSYSPIIYFKKTVALLEQGLHFDEVIVFLDISDIYDEADIYTIDDAGHVIERARQVTVARSMEPWRAVFRDNSVLYGLPRLFRTWWQFNRPSAELESNWLLRYPRGNWTVDESLWLAYGQRGVAQAEAYLTQLAQRLRKEGIAMTLVVYPWPNQIFYGDLPSRQETIWQRWAREHQVQFIDLFPDFIGADPQQNKTAILSYYIPNDMHWNEAGHRYVAQRFLARFQPACRAGLACQLR